MTQMTLISIVIFLKLSISSIFCYHTHQIHTHINSTLFFFLPLKRWVLMHNYATLLIKANSLRTTLKWTRLILVCFWMKTSTLSAIKMTCCHGLIHLELSNQHLFWMALKLVLHDSLSFCRKISHLPEQKKSADKDKLQSQKAVHLVLLSRQWTDFSNLTEG